MSSIYSVLSELYCVSPRRSRRFENKRSYLSLISELLKRLPSMKGTLLVFRSFLWVFHKRPEHIFKTLHTFWTLSKAQTIDVPVLSSMAQCFFCFFDIWQERVWKVPKFPKTTKLSKLRLAVPQKSVCNKGIFFFSSWHKLENNWHCKFWNDNFLGGTCQRNNCNALKLKWLSLERPISLCKKLNLQKISKRRTVMLLLLHSKTRVKIFKNKFLFFQPH